MGQKTNPVSLRLHYTNRHFDTSWYSGYFYKQLLTKDLFLQNYLNNFLKLLKLPSGRYSIHHLQKKTQIFNFLCYSKSTRDWRSKIFGLTSRKNKFKTNRYFSKNSLQLRSTQKLQNQKNRPNKGKLKTFYTTVNLLAIHKIQKKITSFQNWKLWSKLIKQVNPLLLESFSITNNWNKSNNLSVVELNHRVYKFPIKNIKTFTNISQHKSIISQERNRVISQSLQIKHNWDKLLKNQDIKYSSSLLFLQNLFVYKALKSKSFDFPNNFIQEEFSKKYPFNTLDSKYKNYLESSLFCIYGTPIDLIPFKVKNDWQYASYLADEIVYFLEKRLAFRRLKTKLLRQLSKISTIRGIRITCSGRVGGKSKKAQRSKTEYLKYGQTSLHVFSSPIDFSCKTAYTSFGSVGVKVWICYY